jgi:hypothetical protein
MEKENINERDEVLELKDEDIVIEFLGEDFESQRLKSSRRREQPVPYRSIVDEFFKLNASVGVLSIDPDLSSERRRRWEAKIRP